MTQSLPEKHAHQSVGQYLNMGEFFEKQKKAEQVKEGPVQKDREPFFEPALWMLILIPLIVCALILSSTASLSVMDGIFEKQIEGAVSNEVTRQIQAQYPQLLGGEISAIAGPKIKETLAKLKQSGALQSAIEENKAKFKAKEGHPYLLEYDAYYFLRYARNVLERGHQGDTLKDEVPFDSLRRKPQGVGAEFTLLPFIEAYFFQVWNLFDSDSSLMESAFYLPVFLGMISVVLVFIIAFLGFQDRIVAFLASLLFAMHPFFFRQNMAGFTDTTIVIMPLSFIFFLGVVLFMRKGVLQKVAAVVIACLALVGLRFSWGGWYFVLGVLAAFFLAYSAFSVWCAPDRESKITRASLAALLGVASLALLWWFGYVGKVLRKFQFTNKMPGIHETVMELMAPSVSVWVENFGGLVFAGLVVAALVISCKRLVRRTLMPAELFFLSWMAVLFLPTLQGNRFMFFLAPPACILAGFSFAKLAPWTADFFSSLDINSRRVVCVVVLFALSSTVGVSMIDTDTVPLPRMNDAIAKTGEWFQANTSRASIINTWWDFGYVWQYASRRGTVLDAGPTDVAHWMSRALLSDNESFAMNVFRMIDCAGHDGLQVLESRLGLSAGYVIEEVLRSDEETAKKILDERAAGDLLNLTHCAPPEAYFLMNRDILDVIPSISTISKWNETLGIVRELVLKIPQEQAISRISEELGLSQSGAEQLYEDAFAQEIAPPDGYVSPLRMCRPVNEADLMCGDFLVDSEIEGAVKGKTHPRRVVIIMNETRYERLYDDAPSEHSLIVFEDEGVFKSMIVSEEYVNSMIVGFYVGGAFDGFSLAHEEFDPERILVWRIEWERSPESNSRSNFSSMKSNSSINSKNIAGHS